MPKNKSIDELELKIRKIANPEINFMFGSPGASYSFITSGNLVETNAASIIAATLASPALQSSVQIAYSVLVTLLKNKILVV